MFESQLSTAQSAVATLSQAAEQAVTDLTGKLEAAQAALTQAQIDLAAAQAKIPAVVFRNLERLPWLTGAGTVANSNQTGSTASSFKTPAGPGLATFGLTP